MEIIGLIMCFLMIWWLSLGEYSIFRHRDLDDHVSLDDFCRGAVPQKSNSILGACLWISMRDQFLDYGGGCPQIERGHDLNHDPNLWKPVQLGFSMDLTYTTYTYITMGLTLWNQT